MDATGDVHNSSIACAISELVEQRKTLFFATATGLSEIHDSRCPANSIQWSESTYSIAKAIGSAIVKDNGESTLYLTADDSFGQALERNSHAIVTATNAKVLGIAEHPLNVSDFYSFLVQAQTSSFLASTHANARADMRSNPRAVSCFRYSSKSCPGAVMHKQRAFYWPNSSTASQRLSLFAAAPAS